MLPNRAAAGGCRPRRLRGVSGFAVASGFAVLAFVFGFSLDIWFPDLNFRNAAKTADRVEGAIYHLMSRGNARQKIVGDDADRR